VGAEQRHIAISIESPETSRMIPKIHRCILASLAGSKPLRASTIGRSQTTDAGDARKRRNA
jgi:hypothetical protein